MTDARDAKKGTQARALVQDFGADMKRKISEFESEKAVGVLLSAPKMIRRELQEMSVFGMLTRFPAATVMLCLFVTAFLAFHSGITDQWTGERSMNVLRRAARASPGPRPPRSRGFCRRLARTRFLQCPCTGSGETCKTIRD